MHNSVKENSEVHYSAGAVVYRKSEEKIDVLIMHRDWTDTYHLPKGTKETNESDEETAIREIFEETNCKIKIESTIGELLSTFKRDGKIINKSTQYFLAEYVSGDPHAPDGEHSDARFTSVEEARKLLAEKGGHTLGYEAEHKLLTDLFD
jgi:8-oxo-dGTP pyrophosphatase MutT (NUDIX family)